MCEDETMKAIPFMAPFPANYRETMPWASEKPYIYSVVKNTCNEAKLDDLDETRKGIVIENILTFIIEIFIKSKHPNPHEQSWLTIQYLATMDEFTCSVILRDVLISAQAFKRILRYVRGTLDHVLQLFSSFTTSLVAYSNADWARCLATRRPPSGYCVFIGNNLLSWSSKHQPTLSSSSAEAEYRGVANVVAETCWLRNLLRDLHTPLSSATLVYCDNTSVVYLSSNPIQHQRTKHIEIDIHFVRDLVVAGEVQVLHVSSRYQYADIFTKGLPSALFEEFRTSLSVRCPPAPTAGEC
ncbi:ribonuclease H-like domain-containing protein [Tanacetum coccineum]